MKEKPNWRDREKKWGTANPYLIKEKKTEIALKWAYDWGWTTPFLVDLLVQSGKRGFAKKLEQTGLLHGTEIYSFTPGMPHKILRITKKGTTLIGREYRHKKLNHNTIWHDYITQIYIVILLLKNGFPQKKISYIPFPNKMTKKNYDAIIGNTGVEVELTKKKPIQANIALFKILLDLQQNFINQVVFVSFSKEPFAPYKTILKAQKVVEYKKNIYKKYTKYTTYNIDISLISKVKFVVIPHLSVQKIIKLGTKI